MPRPESVRVLPQVIRFLLMFSMMLISFAEARPLAPEDAHAITLADKNAQRGGPAAAAARLP